MNKALLWGVAQFGRKRQATISEMLLSLFPLGVMSPCCFDFLVFWKWINCAVPPLAYQDLTINGYNWCAVQIDSDTTLLVHASKPLLGASASAGHIQGHCLPHSALAVFRIAGDGLTVARWRLRAALAPLAPLESRYVTPFLVSKCWSVWSEEAEWGKKKSWMLKPKRGVQHAFFPYIGMRRCSLDVTDKIPSTLAGLLNSTPATGKWCLQESLNTIFEIWVNF